MKYYELGELESKIIHSIYEAALNPSYWKAVLNDICQFVDANEVSLIFHDLNFPWRNFLVTAVTPNNNDYVASHIHSEAEKIKLLFADTDPGHILTARDIAIKTGISYENYIGEPANISDRQAYQVNVGVMLMQSNTICSAMGYHKLRDGKELDENALVFIRRLTPHFVRALNIHAHLSELNEKNKCFLEAIKATNLPIFLLNESLKVIFKSSEADQIIYDHPSLRISNLNELKTHFSEDQIKLDRALSNVLKRKLSAIELGDSEISIAVKHPSRQHPVRLVFTSLYQENIVSNNNVPSIAIIANNPNSKSIIDPAYLIEAYGLTNSEIEIGQLLLSGYNLNEISQVRNTSIETTRWHVKQMMSKTQTHSQSELIRTFMVLSREYT